MVEKLATLTEIEQNWTLNDLADAHEVCDIMNEMQAAASKQGT